MRIIGGKWRGTRLPVANARGLRPTPDRVRETVFNWLQPHLPGARILDLFAGSGALGLETLSRGAREAFLVESNPVVVQHLHAAVDKLAASEAAHVIRADAIAWLAAPLFGTFDVVFADPPFQDDLLPAVLHRLSPWLAADALLYLESPVTASPAVGGHWLLQRQGSTRDIHYALYRRASGAAATLIHHFSSDASTPSSS